MNRTLTAIAIALAAGSAFADDITIDPTPFVSTRTRDEVRAELMQAIHEGTIARGEDWGTMQAVAGDASRDEVRAGYLAARDQVSAMNGEDSGSMYLSAHAATIAPPVMAAAGSDEAE